MMQRCYESEKYSVYDGEKNETKELSERLITKREYVNSHNKDQKHSCGLNGHETRGVWIRTMIAASDSS